MAQNGKHPDKKVNEYEMTRNKIHADMGVSCLGDCHHRNYLLYLMVSVFVSNKGII